MPRGVYRRPKKKDKYKRLRIPPDPGSPLLERMQKLWDFAILKPLPFRPKECLSTYVPAITSRPERMSLTWIYALPPHGLRYVHVLTPVEKICDEKWWYWIRCVVAQRILEDMQYPRRVGVVTVKA